MKRSISKSRWLVLLNISAGSWVCYIPYAWSAFQPMVAREMMYSASSGTSVLPVCSLFYGLFSVIGGQWRSKPPRFIYLLGSLLVSAAYLIFCVSPAGAGAFPVICFGVIFGSGYGLIYSAVTPSLLSRFPDHRGMAIGVMSGSSSVFLMLFTYLGTLLTNAVGVRVSFGIYGAVTAAVLFGTFFAIHLSGDPERREVYNSRVRMRSAAARNITPPKLFYSRSFWMLFMAVALALPAYQLFNARLYTLAVKSGLSDSGSLLLVSAAPLFSAMGSFLIPSLSDRLGRIRVICVLWGSMLAASLLIISTKGMLFAALFLVLPFAYYGGSGIATALITELFGRRHARENVGLFNCATSVGSLLTLIYSEASGIFDAGDISSLEGALSCGMAFSFCLMLAKRRHVWSRGRSTRIKP